MYINLVSSLTVLILIFLQGCSPHRLSPDREISEVNDSYSEAVNPNIIRPNTTAKFPTIRHDTVIRGKIKDNFYSSFNRAGGPNNIGKKVVEALSDRINFNQDLHNGDTFVIIYANDKITYIEFNLIKLGTILVYGKETTMGTHYFDDHGAIIHPIFLVSPVKYSRISSGFNTHRLHPILKKVMPHNGVDLVAKYGAKVLNVSDGYVSSFGNNVRSGIYISIKHDDGISTSFSHLSKLEIFKVGEHVKSGQILGYVGNTGMTTGTHLHYELKVDGTPIDPEVAMNPNEHKLSPSQMAKLSNYVEGRLIDAYAAYIN